ncbi:MAG: hypothetical protein R2724_24670 [Bryobacterales bacterium]
MVASVLIVIATVVLAKTLPSRTYANVWVAGFILSWSLMALALTEASVTSLQRFPKFGQVASMIVRTILVVTGLLIVGLLFFAPAPWTSGFFRFLQAQGHLVQSSMALLGVSMLGFTRWARLRMSGNGKLIVTVLTIFCIGEALMASGVIASLTPWMFYAGIAWSTRCWGALAWMWSSAPEPAERPLPPTGGAWGAREDLEQMRSTNDHLSDLLRRG